MQKEDLFDAHNFDIEIDVNTDLMGKLRVAWAKHQLKFIPHTMAANGLEGVFRDRPQIDPST